MAKRRETPAGQRAWQQETLTQIQANGGEYYITNCLPWDVPAACKRLDCPMRDLLLPPESTPNAYHFECDPPGQSADLLIMLRNTTPHPTI